MSPLIIKKLEIVKPSLSQIKLYDQILIQMDELVNEKIKKKLKKSKFLNNVNWNNVKSNIFNKEYDNVKTNYKLIKQRTRLGSSIKSINHEELMEARFRFLKITKSLYWKYFSQGFCNGYVAVQLMQTADECVDELNEALNDWTYVYKEIVSGFIDKIISKVKYQKYFFFKVFNLKAIINQTIESINWEIGSQ